MRALKLFVLILAITGCSKMNSRNNFTELLMSFMGESDTELNPRTDRLDSSCYKNSNYDACVIMKNPVAQRQRPMGINEIALTFGVRLRDLNQTTGIENGTISIQTIHTPRLNPFVGPLKGPWSTGHSYVEQVNAYYWMNRFISYLKSRLGHLAVSGKNIRVVADDDFNGWSYKYNSIHLKRKSGEFSAALQGDLAIYFLAQAETDWLTQGQMELGPQDVLHKFCGSDPHGCCQTKAGCSKALRSAVGDYFVSVMFPSLPRIGETLSQNTQGQNYCGQRRDLAVLSQTDVSEVYQMCADRVGDVYAMGAFYASMWWEIRGKAAGQWSDGARVVDQLFHHSMAQWVADDTFVTAKIKALSIAQSFESGRLHQLVNDVFGARGL